LGRIGLLENYPNKEPHKDGIDLVAEEIQMFRLAIDLTTVAHAWIEVMDSVKAAQ